MRSLVAALILAVPSAAVAAPDPLPPPNDVVFDSGVGGWSAFAQVDSETTRAGADATASAGEVVAGAELHRDVAMCRLLALGIEGRLREDRDGVTAGGEQWLGACFGMAHIVAVELAHHLELELRPSLTARRELWRRPYTRETASTHWGDFDVLDGRLHISAVHGEFVPAWVVQSAEGHARELLLLDGGVGFGELSGPRRPGVEPWRIAIIDGHDATVDDGRFTVETFDVAIVRARNLPLGPLLVDASIGVQVGSLTRDDLQAPMVLVDTTKPGGDLALHTELGGVIAGIGIARTEYPTFAAELAREDRASAWLTFHRWQSQITIRSFAAQTDVQSATAVQRGITGGGQTQLDRDLRHLHLQASAEVARSYYANLDPLGDPAPRPELAARLSLSLSARAGSPAR